VGVFADLLDPSLNNGDAAGDLYSSIEGLAGTAYSDLLVGDNNTNALYGLAGNDGLYGSAGSDTIDGGGGADTLVGGADNDLFLFTAGEANGDVIVDFAGNCPATGDQIRFTGYGTAAAGATLTQVDATQWSINSANGLIHDIITLSNGATIHQSDYLFA
jgi:Ca2+-binding RTX toxin-like protein